MAHKLGWSVYFMLKNKRAFDQNKFLGLYRCSDGCDVRSRNDYRETDTPIDALKGGIRDLFLIYANFQKNSFLLK